jgi:hypothetical protein
MVEDQVVAVIRRDDIRAVVDFVLIAQAKSQVANDDVRRLVEMQVLILDRDPVARRGLARNGEMRPRKDDLRFPLNGAGEIESRPATTRDRRLRAWSRDTHRPRARRG